MKNKLIALAVAGVLSPQIHAATYKVVELGSAETAKHSYVTDFNDDGTAIGVLRDNYNLPIDISAIDFEDNSLDNAWKNQEKYEESIDKQITFTLQDIESGNINADALSFMLSFLSGKRSDPNWQKVDDTVVVSFDSGTQEQVIFDSQLLIDSGDYQYDGLSRSVRNNLTAISENGVKVGWGSPAYTKEMFTPDGETQEELFYLREFESRGIVIKPDGSQMVIEPEFNEHGGMSIITDISQRDDGGYVLVGDVSTGIPEDRQKNLDDNCDGKDEPEAVCVWLYKNQSNELFDRRAVKWTLDSEFNLTNTEILGLALTPEDDEDFAFKSTALTVNAEGIAAGYSHVRRYDNENRIDTMPVYFKDGEIISYITQNKNMLSGQASDINDNNIIVGFMNKAISGTTRTKFYYHDINTGQTMFPEDYFSSSSSIARDINNQGIIVGEGETETNTSSNRRREAFMYEIHAEKFTNINDLLPCYASNGQDRYPYVVAEATGINENNEIIGSATKTVKKRDKQGNIVIDSTGQEEFESVVVAVKLVPIEGDIEKCPTQASETYERQGASFGFLSVLLLPLVAIRRRFFL